MICVVIKGPSYEEAHRQLCKAMLCADLVELRLDGFDALDFEAIRKLQSTFRLPMIFTLRSQQQGGNYQQPEQQRLEDLYSLAELKPEYLDLEYHVPLRLFEEIKKEHPEIQLIASYHNFKETPSNIEGIYHEMAKIPANFYKIAMTAQDSVDALRLCCWAKSTNGNVVAISMGLHGQLSRILAPVIKSPIAYASLEDGLESAPGQLSANILLTRYRHRILNSDTALFGLIGDPVDLSISDETHNGVFQSLDLNAVYVKMAIKEERLREFLHLTRQFPFKGLSVTMPLKESVMSCLDDIDQEAIAIGAVNTLVFNEGKITGYNTDGKGALNAIEQLESVKNKRIVLLGAGGAAKAIAFEAHRRGGLVTILNRNKEKAQHLARRFNCAAEGLDRLKDYAAEQGYDILINSTPLSMPVGESDILPHVVVMDIKTKPIEPLFLKHAKDKGCRIVYGYKMFIEQAIGQFSLWFASQLNHQRCRSILEREVEKALLLGESKIWN